MPLSVMLLLCCIILCVFTTLEPLLRDLQISCLKTGFLALCLLALSRFTLPISSNISLAPAAMLPVFLPACLLLRQRQRKLLFKSFCLCVPVSILMVLLLRMFPHLSEPGLLLGIFCGACLLPLCSALPAALFGAGTAPLLLGAWNALLEYHAFGYSTVCIGGGHLFDAQLVAVGFVCLFRVLLLHLRARRRPKKPLA